MNKKVFKKKGFIYLLTLMIFSLMFSVNIFALPQGGQVVSGQAEISVPDASTMQINQLTNTIIINWQQFSIAHPELVQFMQPGASSIALNRVLGGDPSQIFGRLSANGGVWLINPNGILVGSSGVFNVNSLLLSTLDINNEDFLSGNYVFNQKLDTTLASIVNQGTITAAQGGHVSLIAPGVVNQGAILANLGKVFIGSGEQVTLNFVANEKISFAIDKAVTDQFVDLDGQPLEDGILNEGTITANGGEIILSVKNAYDAIKSVVNNKGIIEAQTLENKNGVIRLQGNDKGIVYNSGTLDVSGLDEGECGGTVEVTGEKVGLVHYSKIFASGRKGGGTVLVGGDFQGKNPKIANAKRTYVGKDATIEADALDEGDGGKVIVWADEVTRFYGSISANGGILSGDGGFIETSGKKYLDFNGIVEGRAYNGSPGTWLLDPESIDITSAEANITQTGSGLDDGAPETFAPTGINTATTIDVANINTALDNGLDVLVQTTSGGTTTAGDITVSAAISKTADGGVGDGSVLTLTADQDIVVQADITSTTGALGVVLNAQRHVDIDNAIITNGGDVDINANLGTGGGNVDIDNTITTGGGAFKSNGVDFDNTNGTIHTGAGALTVNHTGNVTLSNMATVSGDIVVTAGGSISAGMVNAGAANNITLDAQGGEITDSAGKITANLLTADAAGAMVLDTTVSSLNASTSAMGTITVTETDDIELIDVDTISGAITARVGGALTATDVQAFGGYLRLSASSMTLGTVAAAGNTVYLDASGTINSGTFTGSSAEINAGTIGLTTAPTANVSTLTMDLTAQVGGRSGELNAGAALTTRPPDGNISSVGTVTIGAWDYLATEVTEVDISAALASLATLSSSQQQLEALLNATTASDFFMTPPLEIYIDMEEDMEEE